MFDFERTEFGDEIYSAIGRCLTFGTRFETGVKSLSALIDIRANPLLPFADSEFEAWLEKLNRRNLYKHITHLKLSDAEVNEKLHSAREARNEIAHEIALGLDQSLDRLPESVPESTIERLGVLAEALAEGDRIVQLLVSALTREPLPNQQFLKRYPESVRLWVTEI